MGFVHYVLKSLGMDWNPRLNLGMGIYSDSGSVSLYTWSKVTCKLTSNSFLCYFLIVDFTFPQLNNLICPTAIEEQFLPFPYLYPPQFHSAFS
ncbi:hypothetical protein L1887_01188 [Cichorium endivia]|nr:hypothetical protein L1887_01188 [Cichorium endivia]